MADTTGSAGSGHRIRFDWTINIGHVLIIVSVVGSAVFGFFELKSRIDVHDRRFGDIERRQQEEADRDREALKEIKEGVKSLVIETQKSDRALTTLGERVNGMDRQVQGLTGELREQRRAGAAPGLPANRGGSLPSPTRDREDAPAFRPQ